MATAWQAAWSFYLDMAGTITAISAQKKNPNRLTIELDGEFGFGLDRLVGAWLRIGDKLSDQQIQDLIKKDTLESAYLSAIRYLSYRLRSRKELVVHLIQKGYSQDQVDEVIVRLIEERLVDDVRFAESWAESRQVFRPRSRKLMTLEMRQKGIEQEVITDVLENVSGDEQLAMDAGKRALRRWQGLDQERFKKKCAAFLTRRGFSYGTISKLLPDLWLALQQMN